MVYCNKSSAGWPWLAVLPVVVVYYFSTAVCGGGVDDKTFSLSSYIIHIQLQLCVCLYVCDGFKKKRKTL